MAKIKMTIRDLITCDLKFTDHIIWDDRSMDTTLFKPNAYLYLFKNDFTVCLDWNLDSYITAIRFEDVFVFAKRTKKVVYL